MLKINNLTKPHQRLWFITIACLTAITMLASFVLAQSELNPGGRMKQGQRGGKRNGGGGKRPMTLSADVVDMKSLSAVLGCPTDKSIVVNMLADSETECYVEYGLKSGSYACKSEKVTLTAGTPVNIEINKLQPDKQYFYRLRSRKSSQESFAEGKESTFHTQRSKRSKFTFGIQGDSHPERMGKQFDPVLYAQLLNAVANDKPDFYMTIGDDFSVDQLNNVTPEAVHDVYATQRLFLGLVGQSAPIFLVNGNHEQAAECNLDGTANNVAVWAQTSRNTYFAQPAPDSFYTGDAQEVEHIGLLRDYYAWTWGDALFVVIDPYWHSPKPVDNVFGGGQKTRDLWNSTLGDVQYKWFKETLEKSKAKYKFVFTHHVLGTGRGGIEQAGLFEWGGKDNRGESQFALERPGWELPIHQLMVKNGVTIFFQGHDHIFAKQELDGVIYQSLPSPADPNYALLNDNAYTSGDKYPNSGRVRVSISPEEVKVEYVRSYLPKDVNDKQKDGAVAFSYTVKSKKSGAEK